MTLQLCPVCHTVYGTDRCPRGHTPPAPAVSRETPAPVKPKRSRKVAEREDARLHTLTLGSVAVRAADSPDGRTISGYAVRWGEFTDEGATAQYGAAREGFARGAFAAAIAARAGRPFPFLNRHRSRGGSVIGGISFTEDEVGLRFDGRLLDTAAAREYAAEVEVADGVSLELIPGEVRRPNARTVIHTAVRRIAGLAGEYMPAYATASVAVRGAERGTDPMHTCPLCGATLELGVAHSCQGPTVRPEPADTGTGPARETSTALTERGGAWAGPMPDAVRVMIDELVHETVRGLAERGGFGFRSAGDDPFADLRGYRTLGELFLAAGQPGASLELRSYAARSIVERALDDTTSNSGANAALLTGNLTVRNIAGIISRGRPVITAFGGPGPLSAVGLSVTWPYFDGTLTDFVAAQSAQKAEITSASLDIKLGTEALVTYAGGSDVAYQLIRKGDPNVLDALAAVLLTAWGVVTDAAFVTELESGSVTSDLGEAVTSVDFAELVSRVIDVSVTVQTATGQPAEFIIAGPAAFAHYAKLIAAASTAVVVNGGLDLRGLDVRLGNLPLILAPTMTTGKAVISNRLAARWHEEGPFQASAEDVAKLGRTVAYWSMGAGARYLPAGIVEVYDVSP